MTTPLKLRFSLRTDFRFSSPVERHVFRIRPLPSARPGQRLLSSTFAVEPAAPLFFAADPVFGNSTWTGRLDAPHASFAVVSEGTVELDPSAADERPPAPYFLLPTTLTAPGPEIRALAQAVKSRTAENASAQERILAAMHAVHDAFVYAPGVTHPTTAAESALALGRGVCQDYAQVLASMLRLFGIPALYAAGLLQGEGATHAWVQAWSGSRWIGVDPTNGCTAERCIELARGRDADDAALERGVFCGCAEQRVTASASVSPAN